MGKSEIYIAIVNEDHYENARIRPSLAFINKIIEFLGYDPFGKYSSTLGDRIREYRRIYGLTQKKLAERLGIDPTTLAGWEKENTDLRKALLRKQLQ